MARNSVTIAASRDAVFAVLADGWTYSNWVVGTSHMRAVSADWPAKGAKIHHTAGPWPVVIRDESQVESVEPGRRLHLTARGRPMGEATIVIELEDHPVGCRMTMVEEPVSGPGKLLHNPVTEALLIRRNTEALARFAALCERRTEPVD